jgi:hypothetical protein
MRRMSSNTNVEKIVVVENDIVMENTEECSNVENEVID